VRTAVLNDTLEHAFRRRHPGFRPANNDRRPTAAAAWSPPTILHGLTSKLTAKALAARP
jgi:hypothetical protein